MIKGRKEISRTTVRNANKRLVLRGSKTGRVFSDDSKNGSIMFTAKYLDKNYHVAISKSEIKTAFRESIEKSTSNK